MLCSSLVSLFWLGPSAAQMNGHSIGGIVVSILVIFFVSIAGVRTNIRTAKQRALDDLAYGEGIRALAPRQGVYTRL